MNRVLINTVPKDSSTSIITTFAYNPSGTLWTVKDANNNITTFIYNGFDLKSKMIYPNDDDSQQWLYDSNQNLIERTTVDGSIQIFGYDSRNRKISMRWSSSVDWSDFGYDKAGRLTSAQNQNSTISREYDPAGRLTHDRQTLPEIAPTPAPSIELPTAVSRKMHGSTGFNIPLPLSGAAGVECRTGGAHQIIATFPGR